MNNGVVMNNGVEFFAAVTKNCNTVIVKRSKKAVKSEITQRRVAKHNVAIFKCRPSGQNAIEKELLNRPQFKLTHLHHTALMDASFAFLR